jgi:hypothetical protein
MGRGGYFDQVPWLSFPMHASAAVDAVPLGLHDTRSFLKAILIMLKTGKLHFSKRHCRDLAFYRSHTIVPI